MEFIIWFGIGGALLIFAFMCHRYDKVEPVFMVMSEKMLEIYRTKKGFNDEQIIGVVKSQGAILLVVGGALIGIGIIRYLKIF